MSDSVGSPSSRPPVRRWFRKFLAGSLLAVILVCGAVAVWFYVLGPQPPEVDLPTDDPGAALDIAEARANAKCWPFRTSKWGRLGVVLASYGFKREAITCFARAAQLSPSSPRWPYLQGIHEARLDLDASVALLERSVQLDGTASTPRLALGEMLIRLGRADEAEKHFQFVLRTNPENPRALYGMGGVANNRSDLPASRDYLKHSARLAPHFKSAHTLLAEVYRRLGDHEQAEMERTLAASLPSNMHWPDSYSTLMGPPLRGQKEMINRANALLKEDRAQESLQLLNAMPPGSGQWYRKHLQLGRAYEKLGDINAAETAFREALRLKPDSFEVFVGLGIVLERQGNFSAAAEQCRKALELKPDADTIHYRLGRCLENEGDRAGAIEAMQNALRYNPGMLLVYHGLARLLAEDGRTTQAREILERALELAPDDSRSQEMLDELVAPHPELDETPTDE